MEGFRSKGLATDAQPKWTEYTCNCEDLNSLKLLFRQLFSMRDFNFSNIVSIASFKDLIDVRPDQLAVRIKSAFANGQRRSHYENRCSVCGVDDFRHLLRCGVCGTQVHPICEGVVVWPAAGYVCLRCEHSGASRGRMVQVDTTQDAIPLIYTTAVTHYRGMIVITATSKIHAAVLDGIARSASNKMSIRQLGSGKATPKPDKLVAIRGATRVTPRPDVMSPPTHKPARTPSSAGLSAIQQRPSTGRENAGQPDWQTATPPRPMTGTRRFRDTLDRAPSTPTRKLNPTHTPSAQPVRATSAGSVRRLFSRAGTQGQPRRDVYDSLMTRPSKVSVCAPPVVKPPPPVFDASLSLPVAPDARSAALARRPGPTPASIRSSGPKRPSTGMGVSRVRPGVFHRFTQRTTPAPTLPVSRTTSTNPTQPDTQPQPQPLRRPTPTPSGYQRRPVSVNTLSKAAAQVGSDLIDAPPHPHPHAPARAPTPVAPIVVRPEAIIRRLASVLRHDDEPLTRSPEGWVALEELVGLPLFATLRRTHFIDAITKDATGRVETRYDAAGALYLRALWGHTMPVSIPLPLPIRSLTKLPTIMAVMKSKAGWGAFKTAGRLQLTQKSHFVCFDGRALSDLRDTGEADVYHVTIFLNLQRLVAAGAEFMQYGHVYLTSGLNGVIGAEHVVRAVYNDGMQPVPPSEYVPQALQVGGDGQGAAMAWRVRPSTTMGRRKSLPFALI